MKQQRLTQATFPNPSWLYNSLGFKTVQLIVGSDKGCIDTVPIQVEVKDKPDLTLPFKDTLICSIDTSAVESNRRWNFPMDTNL